MITINTVLLAGALVCFAIPAIRALLKREFDYTDSGLALLTLALLLG